MSQYVPNGLGGAGAKWRVLVVDDEPDIRALIRVLLNADGRFEVVAEAANGQEAVERAQRDRPDIVVLDLAMPVMDGMTALPLIRVAAPESRIAVCSAHGEVAARVLSAGADAYIDKYNIHRGLGGVLAGVCEAKTG